jgi:hypothetical protein
MAPLVASILVLVVFIAAGFFAWQQVRLLTGLRRSASLSPEDYRYLRNQGWRRLFGCALLVTVGVLMSWYYVGGMDAHIDALGEAKEAQAKGEPPLNAEQQQSARFYVRYVGAVLILLMVLMFVAAWDVWAIRRFGARHYRRIQDDRRAMLQRQLAQLRRERGHQHNGETDDGA